LFYFSAAAVLFGRAIVYPHQISTVDVLSPGARLEALMAERKLSNVSNQEKMAGELQIATLFNTFSENGDRISEAQVCKMFQICGAYDGKLDDNKVKLFYAGTKVGKNPDLNLDRFKVCAHVYRLFRSPL
jgi:hypothetical protein